MLLDNSEQLAILIDVEPFPANGVVGVFPSLPPVGSIFIALRLYALNESAFLLSS